MGKTKILEYSYLLALLRYCYKENLVSEELFSRIYESINHEYGIRRLP